jgi:hypothetical protein
MTYDPEDYARRVTLAGDQETNQRKKKKRKVAEEVLKLSNRRPIKKHAVRSMTPQRLIEEFAAVSSTFHPLGRISVHRMIEYGEQLKSELLRRLEEK